MLESGDQHPQQQLLENAPPGVQQVVQGTRALKLYQECRFHHVESDYYDWSLEKRMERLGAPSIHHLCKSMIFENTKHEVTNDNLLDPTNSKYYCVIVQYTDKIHTQKLMNFIRDLNGRILSKKKYNMRVAPEEVSLELTGFVNNAVSPIGMKTEIPIIMTDSISKLDPPVLYLGSGHVDWKIAVPIKEFIDKAGIHVAEFSS